MLIVRVSGILQLKCARRCLGRAINIQQTEPQLSVFSAAKWGQALLTWCCHVRIDLKNVFVDGVKVNELAGSWVFPGSQMASWLVI